MLKQKFPHLLTDKRLKALNKLEFVLVIVILGLAFFPRVGETPIHKDECSWIAQSYFLEEWFRFDPESSIRENTHYNLLDPNVTKYLIGVGRLLMGIPEEDINGQYDFDLSFDENQAMGNVPDSDLLFAARLPMVVLVFLMGLLVFTLLKQHESGGMAWVWILMLVNSDYLWRILDLAMNESPLLFFSVLSAWLTYLGIQQLPTLHDKNVDRKLPRSYVYFLLNGVALGIAISTKVNAFLLIPTMVLLIGYSVFREKETTFTVKLQSFFLTVGAVLVPALLLFLLFHPVLWANPFTRILEMAQHRLEIMNGHILKFPEYSQIPVLIRLKELVRRMVTSYAPFEFKYGKYVLFVLILTGIIRIGYDGVKHLKQTGQIPLIATMLIFFSGMVATAFLSPLDWARYYLFPVFLTTIFLAKGIEQCFALLLAGVEYARKKLHPQETT